MGTVLAANSVNNLKGCGFYLTYVKYPLCLQVKLGLMSSSMHNQSETDLQYKICRAAALAVLIVA